MVPFYEIQPEHLNVIYNVREIRYPSHLHDSIEIIYTFSGIQRMKIDKTLYSVTPGSALVIFPNMVHEYVRPEEIEKKNKNAQSVCLICDSHIFYSLFPPLRDMVPLSPLISAEKISQDAAFAFHHIADEKNEPARMGWAYIILARLTETLSFEKQDAFFDTDITKKIITYLGENFRNSITLESLAKDLNVSKFHLSHLFSERIKISFRSYLGMLRAEYAATLIRTTNDSFTEIASLSGFDSQRSFNRIFRAIYGLTPSQYRSNVRKYIYG